MFSRRRATQAELDQGADEILRAQQRVEAELATGSEMQLEDTKGPETMVPEPPKSPVQEESLGREDGPRSSPKSLVPAVPGQEKFQVPPVTPESQVRTEVKTPAQSLEAKAEPQGAVAVRHEVLVPAVTDVVAADFKKTENGGSTDLQRASDVSGHRQQVPMPVQTPGAQSVVSPMQQPLFDDQQLRRFQDLFNQAPWLYAGGHMGYHPPAVAPPVSRPLFLTKTNVGCKKQLGWVRSLFTNTCQRLEFKRVWI